MNNTVDAAFLTELTAALAERGWIAEPVLDIQINLLTGGAGPRFTDYTSPTDGYLRVTTRLERGCASVALDAGDWKLDLAAARSIPAALAAICAAEEEDEDDERPLVQLLHEAGWTSSLDYECRHGVERTWYSPDGARRLRNDLTYPFTPQWFLTVAPDFTEGKHSTGGEEVPPAVIAALAIAA